MLRALGGDLLALVALLLGLAAFLRAVAPAQPASLAFPVDDLPPGVALNGIYGIEHNAAGAYVWTRPDATLVLPLRGPGDYELTLTLQSAPLAGERPLAATLGDAGSVAVVPDSTAREYRFVWSYPLAAWRPGIGELPVRLQTAAFTPPGDSRGLGMIVTRIAFTPTAQAPWLTGVVLPWLTLIVAAFVALRLARCPRPGAVALLAVPLLGAATLALIHRDLLAFLAIQAIRQRWLVAALGAAVLGAAALARLRTARWSWIWAAWIGVAALPVAQLLVIGWQIWHSTPQAPWWDEWDLVIPLRRADRGQFALTDFWGFQNQHRIFLPRLILFALIRATAWNRPWIMTLNLALGALALVLFGDLLRRRLGHLGALALLVPTSLLVLSLGQFENWLFAFQLNFILATFGAACCCWASLVPTVADRWRWALLVAGALVASLSSLGGLCLWIAFFPVVLRCGRRLAALWCGGALALFAIYFVGFPFGERMHASLSVQARYFLAYLGAPLGAPGATLSGWYGLGGLLALAACCAYLWRRGGYGALPLGWLCLASYALANAALTTYGRAGADIDQTLYSRYQSFAMLWWVALLGLCWQVGALLWDRPLTVGRWPLVASASVAASLLLVGLIRTNEAGFRAGPSWMGGLRRDQNCVREYYQASDDCLLRFYPSSDGVRSGAAYLEQHRLALFDDPLTPGFAHLPASGEALAAIDSLDGMLPGAGPFRYGRGHSLRIDGWALDRAVAGQAAAVYIVLDGSTTYRANYGQQRPDIAARLEAGGATGLGFVVTLPAELFSPGRHWLTVRVVSHDRQAYADAAQPVWIEVH